jgi:serpin B
MGGLLGDLNAAHDDYQLSVANALWAQQGYTFLDAFLKLLKTDYGAGLNQVDFKGATEAARLTINQWVEQKTQDKIKDLLQPGALRPSTR